MYMVIINELKPVLNLKQQTPLKPVLMPHQKGIHSSFPRNRRNQYTKVFSLRPALILWAVIKFHARKRPASTPKKTKPNKDLASEIVELCGSAMSFNLACATHHA